MSLDKAIEHRKEHRKQYTGSEAIDKSCRCHGGCEWCLGNRQHKNLKRVQESINTLMEEWYDEKLIEQLTWEWYNDMIKEEHKDLYELYAFDMAMYFHCHMDEFGGYRPM